MNILKIKRALAELVWTGALLFAAASVFLRPGAAAGGVLRGLSVCYETVIPALFPFLVLSRLLLESRAASALGLLLRPYTRLLGLHSTKAPAAMLCGVLGGFAGGAKAVDVLYRTGELTAAEAALLLVCTIGSGPGFVVSSVGALMLGSAGAGWLPHFLFACANAAAWRAVSGPPWPAQRKRAKACPPAAVPSRKKHSRTPFRLRRVLFPPYGTRSTPS